ncbi:transposase [Aliifodinibius sp. S!AR15-10]|uniref:transposase n=1 Tax=Aliifodinibius sp. S!AR15-10 TaxID=2950437 RepID=UPI00285DA475|nr:transposase [Aliifodinibius sp. S!AR15-10]
MSGFSAGHEPSGGQLSRREIHVIPDNLNIHKPKTDRWLARHKNVHFHFTPTHGSWLNQFEYWFSILQRKALRTVSFTSTEQLRGAIDSFIEGYSKTGSPVRMDQNLR